jgi:hypothetical protein
MLWDEGTTTRQETEMPRPIGKTNHTDCAAAVVAALQRANRTD